MECLGLVLGVPWGMACSGMVIIWPLLQGNGGAMPTLSISSCRHGVHGISAVIIGRLGAFPVCTMVISRPAGVILVVIMF